MSERVPSGRARSSSAPGAPGGRLPAEGGRGAGLPGELRTPTAGTRSPRPGGGRAGSRHPAAARRGSRDGGWAHGAHRGAAPLWGRGRARPPLARAGPRLPAPQPAPPAAVSGRGAPGARPERRGPPQARPRRPGRPLPPSARPSRGNSALGDPPGDRGPAPRREPPAAGAAGARRRPPPGPRPLTPPSRGCPPAPSRACPSRLAPRPAGGRHRAGAWLHRSARPALPLALGLRRPAAPSALYFRGRGVTSRPRPVPVAANPGREPFKGAMPGGGGARVGSAASRGLRGRLPGLPGGARGRPADPGGAASARRLWLSSQRAGRPPLPPARGRRASRGRFLRVFPCSRAATTLTTVPRAAAREGQRGPVWGSNGRGGQTDSARGGGPAWSPGTGSHSVGEPGATEPAGQCGAARDSGAGQGARAAPLTPLLGESASHRPSDHRSESQRVAVGPAGATHGPLRSPGRVSLSDPRWPPIPRPGRQPPMPGDAAPASLSRGAGDATQAYSLTVK